MKPYVIIITIACLVLFSALPFPPSFGPVRASASEIEETTPTPTSSLVEGTETAEPAPESPNYMLLLFALAVMVLLLLFVFGGVL